MENSPIPEDDTAARSKLKSISVGDGIHTDIYERSTENKSHNIKIVIVPGNPGVISLYMPFIDYLYDSLRKEYTVIGVAHAGHGNAKANNDRIFTLEEQIHHKEKVLEAIGDKDSQFILIGHSIGCYMILKLLHRRPDLPIFRVYNLFPTFTHLWKGMSPFTKLVILPYVRNSISTILHYVPTSAVRKLLEFNKALPAEARYLVSDAMYYYNIMNALSMGYTEACDILDVDDDCKKAIENNMKKMVFLYGPKDNYAPEAYYHELKKLFPDVNAHLAHEDIAHTFVLKHSTHVADKLKEWILQ